MIFNEIYSAYYNTIAAVLKEAVVHPVSDKDIRKIVEKHAFNESLIYIPDAIKEERWQLIRSDGTTPIKNTPTLPLSNIQKQWLKAVACDPRIKLFGDIDFDFPGIEPLFLPSDIIVFDKYLDGDDYTDEIYVKNFRLILDAIRNTYPLEIAIFSKQGKVISRVVLPEYLEYSEKDDKFRLIGFEKRFKSTINLGRIISCKPYEKSFCINHNNCTKPKMRSVIFELTDKRKALERVLLHFAHFEKMAEKIDEDIYRVTINYDKEDETEVVIRMLSFGPMVKVTEPNHFVDLIKMRLIEQKSCGH